MKNCELLRTSLGRSLRPRPSELLGLLSFIGQQPLQDEIIIPFDNNMEIFLDTTPSVQNLYMLGFDISISAAQATIMVGEPITLSRYSGQYPYSTLYVLENMTFRILEKQRASRVLGLWTINCNGSPRVFIERIADYSHHIGYGNLSLQADTGWKSNSATCRLLTPSSTRLISLLHETLRGG
jgi:hypothetical protein